MVAGNRLTSAGSPQIHAYPGGGYYQGGKPPEAVADEIAAYIEQGFTAVKAKTGGPPLAQDVDRLRACARSSAM